MKLLKLLMLLILLLIIGGILLLGYLGFIPVLSSVMGSDKPRDLGIKYTQQQYSDYITKANEQISLISGNVSPENSITYSGKVDLKQSFTPEEISARLDYSKWEYMPATNTQLRINPDGSVEFSGEVLSDRINGFVAREGAGQYSAADVNKGLEYIKLLGKNFPVYVKFRASITNNQLTEIAEKIEVGRFSIPLKTVNADSVISSVSQTIMGRVPGFYAKSVTFTNRKMNFEGTVPEKVTVASN
jgi:hypothetical protein